MSKSHRSISAYSISISELASHLHNLRKSKDRLESDKSNRNAAYLHAAGSSLSITKVIDKLGETGELKEIWKRKRQRILFLRILSQTYVVLTFYSHDPFIEPRASKFFKRCATSIESCLRSQLRSDPKPLIVEYADTPEVKPKRSKGIRKVYEQFIAAVLSSPAKHVIPALNEIVDVFSKDKVEKIKQEIEKNGRRVADFLGPHSEFTEPSMSRAIFLNLREWNSYTPSVPATRRVVRGGGYFIRYEGHGIVIDPGYDFIKNFSEAGGRVFDIDHIIVTHAHDDHTHDFESLLVLLHQYNEKNKVHLKRVHLYLSQSAARKFSGYLRLREVSYIKSINILNPGRRDNPQTISLGGLENTTLTVLPAHHDDIIAMDCAVGLGFRFQFGRVVRTLVFTGDTGLYPAKRNEKNEPLRDDNGQMQVDVGDGVSHALYSLYPPEFMRPDLLVAHIGSIKDYEFTKVPDDAFAKPKTPDLFYPNHLGYRGLALFLSNLCPKAVIVGEFGEELGDIRFALVRGISRFLQKQGRTGKNSVFIIPGDFTTHYDIKEAKFFSLSQNTMAFRLSKELEFLEHDQPEHSKFYCPDVKRVYLFKKPVPKDHKDIEVAITAYHAEVDGRGLTELCNTIRFP